MPKIRRKHGFLEYARTIKTHEYLSLSISEKKKVAFIKKIWTNIGHRNKGCATRLLNYFISYCQKEGYDFIVLLAMPFACSKNESVYEKQLGLKRFYRKFGFKSSRCDYMKLELSNTKVNI